MSFERSARWVPLLAVGVVAVGLAGQIPSSPAPTPPEESRLFGLPDQHSPEAAWWSESMKTRDERVRWWGEARFGMFVHWGVYSGLGNTFRGRKGGGYAEHIQRVLRIPIPEYREQVAATFNPVEFDADAWIRAARDAGMGYFVITAKHHDGFAMWDSHVNDYTIVRATPFHRDPMKELQAACGKYGLKFGFYYSHAFDWGDANAPGNDWDYDNPGGDKLLHGGRTWWDASPERVANVRKYVDGKAIPQLLELIKTYDPDIFWFDTPSKLPPSENLRVMKAVREASPRVVINGRLVYGWGDYDSTTDRPAEFPPHAGDWEGIPTTNESYGWNPLDSSHKPPSHFIRLLAKAAARGGNLLMNVGPMGTGRMDSKDLAILAGIGDWWRVNHESIRGTERTPLAVQAWGESTRRGGTLYLHVFEWPSDGKLVVGGLRSDVRRAWPLSDPKRTPLSVRRLNPLDVGLEVPIAPPDQVDSVVVLECAAAGEASGAAHPDDISADASRLLQPGFPGDTLRAFDAELHGSGLKFGPGKVSDAHVEGWSSQNGSVEWRTRLNVPATYDVAAVYDATNESAGNAFTVSVGQTTLTGKVEAGSSLRARLGRVSSGPGAFSIRVAPAGNFKGELFRLRSLELTTVKD
jgi:alpha-L-fucosidase